MKPDHQITIKEFNTSQPHKQGRKLAILLCYVLSFFVLVSMLHYLFQNDIKHAVACFKVLVIFVVPWIVERIFKLELPSMLSISLQLFAFAAIILGEINMFYMKYPFWDVILHTYSGFLWAAVGFMIFSFVFQGWYKKCVSVSPLPLIFAAFCVSMTIGGVWELYEFGMDQAMNRDMQKDTIVHTIKSVQLDSSHSLVVLNNISSVAIDGRNLMLDGYLDIGLYDTMYDLINNFIGAFVFGSMAYFDYRCLKGKIIGGFFTLTKL
jgi:hypothetical protein